MDLRTIGVLSNCYIIITVSQCLVFPLPLRAHLEKLLAYCEEGRKVPLSCTVARGLIIMVGGKRGEKYPRWDSNPQSLV